MSTRFVAAHSLAPAQLDQQKAFVAWTQSKHHLISLKIYRRSSISTRKKRIFFTPAESAGCMDSAYLHLSYWSRCLDSYLLFVFDSIIDVELVQSIVDQYPDQQFLAVENVPPHRMSHDLYDILKKRKMQRYNNQ